MTALNILVEEKLADRALALGEIFREGIKSLNHPLVAEVRGKGLLNAVVINESGRVQGKTASAWQLCLLLRNRGVLVKPRHVNM
jgi:ornithine--oxo-acid transaminase